MSDTMPINEGLNFEEIWALFQEVARRQEELDRQFKETDRQISKLGSRIGQLIEHFAASNILEKFTDKLRIADTSIGDQRDSITHSYSPIRA